MDDGPVQTPPVENNAADAVSLTEELGESPFGRFSAARVRRLAEASGRLPPGPVGGVLSDPGPDASPGGPVGSDAFLASEQQLALAVDAARMVIFDWNVLTGKTAWSHHHAALFGVTGEPCDGKFDAPRRHMHPDDRAGTIEKIERSLAGGDELDHEYRVVWPDGGEHWIEARGRVFRDNQGRAARMIGTIADVTQRKAAELSARVREAEMAHLSRVVTMGHMASGLAHELSQPLAAIVNYASAGLRQLESQPGPAAAVLEAIREILDEANRAGTIISHMRSFVRKQEPSRVPLDINELARGAVRMVEFELRRGRVLPHLRLADNLPEVSGDAVRIEQVLVNLLLNALQAIGTSASPLKGLTVTTVLHEQGRSVQVCIIDTGPGVSPENMGRLFEPFFTTKPGGMGMGLNICRSIIESQGGELTVSANPDRGMQFSFTVPVVKT